MPKARITPTNMSSSSLGVVYAWQKSGWQPFLITIIARMDKYLIKIIGNSSGVDMTVYAKSVLVRHNQIQNLTSDCIAHIKKLRSEEYELSALTLHGTILTFRAYASQIAARKGSGHKDVKWSFTNSSSRHSDASQEIAGNSLSMSGNVAETSPGNAMSLAYAKALSKKQK